jgi:hypothetical protein
MCFWVFLFTYMLKKVPRDAAAAAAAQVAESEALKKQVSELKTKLADLSPLRGP